MKSEKSVQVIRWYLRQWRQYAGILALAGLGLLMLAGTLYLQKLRPLQKDLLRRDMALTEAAHKLKQMPASAASAASSVADRLPHSSQFTTFLLTLNQLAEQKHIVLQQSDYKASPEVNGELLRYSLQFPASGIYPDLQQFIAALEKMPGVRIENLNLSRPQISEQMLTIQMQLSYLSEVQP